MEVISTRFAEGYKRSPDETESVSVFEAENTENQIPTGEELIRIKS
jgi:hypothetical protein